jgi:tetratricopeptide (TPR) repeat protein
MAAKKQINAPKKQADGVLPLVIFFAVLAVFLPCVLNGFVNFDDYAYVASNAHVRQGLTADGIKWAWSNTESSNWHPLTWMSHMLDVSLFGLKPAGHHFTSVLIHALNAALLFIVLRRMTGARWRSALVAALFGLHPLRVESVAWISERKDVLCCLFWLLTIWAYICYVEPPQLGAKQDSRKKWYGLALGLGVLGLLAKPMVVTLPFALLLLDYWPLSRWPKTPLKKLLLEKIPFFAIAVAGSLVAFMAQNTGGSVTPGDTLTLSARLANAAVSYVRYIGMSFWPANLCVMYPHPGHWPADTVACAALALAVLSIIVMWQWKTRPSLAVGWFWFLGTLVPTIGLVQVGRQALADRYTYIPCIGLWLAVVWWAARWSECWPRRAAIAGIVSATALAACAFLTVRQIGYWKDSKTLFARAMASTPRNWIVAGALADELQRAGQLDDAQSLYQQAIDINPFHNEVRFKYGKLLLDRGHPQEAAVQFQKILEAEPNDVDAHQGLGAAYHDLGRINDAIGQFNEVILLKPEFADAYANLGNCLGTKGLTDEAIRCFEQAVKLQPGVAANHRDYAIGLANKGRLDDAAAQLQKALELDPNDLQARKILDQVLANKAKAGR